MTNVSILRGKIAERNTTQEAIANAMGINRSTFYRKMKEEGKFFTIEEVQKMAKILSLNEGDIMKIFFAL